MKVNKIYLDKAYLEKLDYILSITMAERPLRQTFN